MLFYENTRLEAAQPGESHERKQIDHLELFIMY